jgi:hypothetical protein
MKKALVWTATSSLELYLIFLWLFNDVQWAGNLVKFWVSFVTIVLFLGLGIPDSLKSVREKGRSVPKEFSYFVGTVTICLLASQGHFLFASFYTLSVLFECAIFDFPQKRQ